MPGKLTLRLRKRCSTIAQRLRSNNEGQRPFPTIKVISSPTLLARGVSHTATNVSLATLHIDSCSCSECVHHGYWVPASSFLDFLPLEVVEMIVGYVIFLRHPTAVASFASTCYRARVLVEKALKAQYRRVLLSEPEFRDLMAADYATFGYKALKDWRELFWERWVQGYPKDDKKWFRKNEGLLLSGRNTVILKRPQKLTDDGARTD